MTLRARLWPLEGVAMVDAKKSGGLLDQYKLLCAIIDSPWATRLDCKVARHVIDRYYPKHGNGRASLRYLEQATGTQRNKVITSLRRLAERGAITTMRQSQGTRPTEYALNFDFPASGSPEVTASGDVPSGSPEVTPRGSLEGTASVSSGSLQVTESYLLNPAYKAEIQIDRVDPAAPLAPPLADGLSATAAGGTAVEEEEERAPAKPTFELLWRTYDFKRGKDEARKAWMALPADVDKVAVIEAAAAWQASWAAQGKPDAPRKHLATWLAKEVYDEDAPTGYQKVEKAKAKAKTKPAGKGEFGIGANTKRFTITAHEAEGSPFADFWETFTFRADDGQEFSKRMHNVSATAEFAEGADVELRRSLCAAAWGKGNVEGDYIGRVVGVNDDKGLAFFHVDQPAAEPEPWAGDVGQFSPFGTFRASILDSACEWNECGQFVTLMLDVSDTSSGMEINRQVEHTFDMETAKGQAFLASICRAVGIASIEDTDVLHGLPMECTITDRGAISYAALPTAIQDAA
jgi:hypothetical protein